MLHNRIKQIAELEIKNFFDHNKSSGNSSMIGNNSQDANNIR